MPQQTEENDPIEHLFRRALEALRLLGKTVHDGRRPPAGVYAFFHYNGHATSALQDCKRIIQRLRTGRRRLNELSYEENPLRREGLSHQEPLSEELQAVLREESDTTELMKLDLESLYIFGGILLDQLSLQAIAVGNISCPKQHHREGGR